MPGPSIVAFSSSFGFYRLVAQLCFLNVESVWSLQPRLLKDDTLPFVGLAIGGQDGWRETCSGRGRDKA